MLSYLKANPDAMQNTTTQSMAKKKEKYSYFVVRDRSGRPYGIKKRTSKRIVRWFVIFVDGSDYEAERLDFDFVGELVIKRQWPKNFAYWRKQIFDQRRRKVAA